MTTKSLIEQGLRKVMVEEAEGAPFKLRDCSFDGGKGYTPEFEHANWERLRDVIYEGRGA